MTFDEVCHEKCMLSFQNKTILERKCVNINISVKENKTTIGKAVYTVHDVRGLLGIGINQAYDLVKSGAFPVRIIGKKYFISKAGFDNWLNCVDVDTNLAS